MTGGFTPAVDGRLRLIDVFCGPATQIVFGSHISLSLGGLSAQVLGRGFLGVQVFFASGTFVIADSVGRLRITPRIIHICELPGVGGQPSEVLRLTDWSRVLRRFHNYPTGLGDQGYPS